MAHPIMQYTLRIKEIEHNIFVVNCEPKPGTAKMLAFTAIMMLACQRRGNHLHLG
jgi:hypothetical protein